MTQNPLTDFFKAQVKHVYLQMFTHYLGKIPILTSIFFKGVETTN